MVAALLISRPAATLSVCLSICQPVWLTAVGFIDSSVRQTGRELVTKSKEATWTRHWSKQHGQDVDITAFLLLVAHQVKHHQWVHQSKAASAVVVDTRSDFECLTKQQLFHISDHNQCNVFPSFKHVPKSSKLHHKKTNKLHFTAHFCLLLCIIFTAFRPQKSKLLKSHCNYFPGVAFEKECGSYGG